MSKGDPCVRCGKPSDDQHHGQPDNLNQGKGMGGTQHDDAEHFTMLDLCRGCHDRAHSKTTIFELEGGSTVRWRDIGGATGTRALALALEDTDEYLAQEWADAQLSGQQAVLTQARVALRFQRKYGGFDHWYTRVADIIKLQTGLSVSVGTVYERAALGTAREAWTGDDESFLHELGMKVAAMSGKAIAAGSDPEGVFDFAIESLKHNRKTAVAGLLKDEFMPGKAKAEGDDDQPDGPDCAEHKCRDCGVRWRA